LQQLAKSTGHSHVWVRKQIDEAETKSSALPPQPIVLTADVTFWGREYGVCVFRAPNLKRNLWWQETSQETSEVYQQGKETLGDPL